MRHSVCVYPQTAEALAAGAEDAELELQSFGLQGVASARAWEERAAFYTAFAARHPGRVLHLHGPFLDLSYVSRDHLILEATRRRIADTLELCRALRPRHLVQHLRCPPYFCRPDRAGRWAQPAAEFWRPWLERFAELGVKVVFENEGEPEPAPALALLEALDGLPCGFCLDVGHAHAFTPLPPLRWVEALGGRIAHFHLHDNAGDDDRHLPPGEGTIGFPGLYAAILRHCPQAVLSLEIEPLAGEGPERVLAALAASRALLARLGEPPAAARG